MFFKITKAIAVLSAAAAMAVSVSAVDWWDDDWDYYWDDYDSDTEYWDEHCSEGFYFSENDDGTVTVTGCEDRTVQRLEIPEKLDGKTVTGIYSDAFHWLMELKSVTIPDSVMWMGSSVFSSCKKLEEVTLSKNIKEIPYNCFYGCESLKRIEIPEGVEKIEYEAFCECYALEELRIPSTVSSISYSAFLGCSRLTLYCRRGSEAARFAEVNEINCVEETPPAGETAMVLGIVGAVWAVVAAAIAGAAIFAKKREK